MAAARSCGALLSLGLWLLSAECASAVTVRNQHTSLGQAGGRADPRAHDWSPVEQQEGLPQVKTGRTYVFLTHHKTGTNLMQQFCNLTARLVTGERDQCAYCFRVIPPKDPADRPSCVLNWVPAHGPLKGTFSRFTLVSSIDSKEFEFIRKYAPDFRAVHMIRDPVKMAMSAYAYNTFLASPEGERFRWDASADFGAARSLAEKLRIEAEKIYPVVEEMKGVDDAAVSDDRVLTLDLESFSEDFDGTARRLFNHMFDEPPQTQLAQLMANSSKNDVKRWPARKVKNFSNVRASRDVNSMEALSVWKQMRADGDPEVLKVAQYVELLGYGSNSTRFAHRA